MANLLVRDDGMGRLLHGAAVFAVDQPATGQAADLALGNFRAGDHDHHALRGLGLADIDGLDARVRVGRTQEVGVCLTRQHHVVGVLAGTREES
jgi:hypothetical protein